MTKKKVISYGLQITEELIKLLISKKKKYKIIQKSIKRYRKYKKKTKSTKKYKTIQKSTKKCEKNGRKGIK